MRAILALGIFMLGLNSAAPEPEYSSLLGQYFHITRATAHASLVSLESSIGRGDQAVASALQPADLRTSDRPIEIPSDAPVTLELLQSPDAAAAANPDNGTDRPSLSMGDLCNALMASAEQNDLPVPFFANLIWQESRLRDDAVSPVGAQGIAQFMPRVAIASGLNDPFDPRQAIPASARLLRTLRQQFGNLGFVAAAYNAGARRVSEWLGHRRVLPRETRTYVVRVTGRSVEDWRKTPPSDSALQFERRLPCRELPTFASLEQQRAAQQKQEAEARAEEAQAKQEAEAKDANPAAAKAPAVKNPRRLAAKHNGRGKHRMIADRNNYGRRQDKSEATREIRHGKHQAQRAQSAAHEKHKAPHIRKLARA